MLFVSGTPGWIGSLVVRAGVAVLAYLRFSSKVLSSSSSALWARAAPVDITRPMPRATTANRSARAGALDEFRTIQTLASVLSIALFLFKIFRRVMRRSGAILPAAIFSSRSVLGGSYQPGSGRFCGGYPQE